ncbi:MAG: type II toxin-antitoxin system YafQ family toxin [Clostridia bacterium]|nr:type II toxin-antitoxin system YafQ family toxin [Clostridia bacterium]
MLKVEFTGQFKKDYKLALKRGCDPKELTEVITDLANGKPLDEKYKDRALENSGNYKGMRECHIRPDWLLIYKIYADRLVLELIRTGTHSDLF